MNYERIEEQQSNLLTSEYDEAFDELEQTYDQFLRQQGELQTVKDVPERLKAMEKSALDVYELGLTDSSISYSQRRQVADKVLEITGVIDKNKGKDNSGNTFVFSDKFADKFMKVAEKMQNSFVIEEDGVNNEQQNRIRDVSRTEQRLFNTDEAKRS